MPRSSIQNVSYARLRFRRALAFLCLVITPRPELHDIPAPLNRRSISSNGEHASNACLLLGNYPFKTKQYRSSRQSVGSNTSNSKSIIPPKDPRQPSSCSTRILNELRPEQAATTSNSPLVPCTVPNSDWDHLPSQNQRPPKSPSPKRTRVLKSYRHMKVGKLLVDAAHSQDQYHSTEILARLRSLRDPCVFAHLQHLPRIALKHSLR